MITEKDLKDKKLKDIAALILSDWDKPTFSALPYLRAMLLVDTLEDEYGYDNGYSIVIYFLVNCSQWRGEVARSVKKELRLRVKEYEKVE